MRTSRLSTLNRGPICFRLNLQYIGVSPSSSRLGHLLINRKDQFMCTYFVFFNSLPPSFVGWIERENEGRWRWRSGRMIRSGINRVSSTGWRLLLLLLLWSVATFGCTKYSLPNFLIARNLTYRFRWWEEKTTIPFAHQSSGMLSNARKFDFLPYEFFKKGRLSSFGSITLHRPRLFQVSFERTIVILHTLNWTKVLWRSETDQTEVKA